MSDTYDDVDPSAEGRGDDHSAASTQDGSVGAHVRRGLENLRKGPIVWLVLLGNRLLVAALLTAAFGAVVFALLWTGVVDLAPETQLLYLFQGLVGGNLTLLTIVLSINQLVLSQEFNEPGELRERIDDVVAYRERVQETAGEPTVPVRPAPFLHALLGGTAELAGELRRAVATEGDPELVASFDDLLDGVTERTEDSCRELEKAGGTVFSALVQVLETNYSRHLDEARRLQTVHGDALSEETSEYLDELVEALERIDVARQYFKSIYMQSELARLSRLLLWVGVPAIGSATLMLFVYASDPSTVVPPWEIRVLVPAVIVLGFVPLSVLFAFVLRVATVAERTVAITPFTTAPQEKVVEEEE